MIFLKDLEIPSRIKEELFVNFQTITCFNSNYPFNIFPKTNLEKFTFKNITILYGGNGSGKSTLLNIIAEKINAGRKQPFNRSFLFDSYLKLCSYNIDRENLDEIKIITSDDVFDYLFDVRSINTQIDKKRASLFEEYQTHKYAASKNYTLDDYEELKKTVDSRNKTMSSYTRERLVNSIVEKSNGESALMYFQKEIKDNSLYILDEPENSLSASSQLKLLKFIEDSARFFNCQFIISTHSPFILSLKDAVIYDLDDNNGKHKSWTELDNVKIYYNFFKERAKEFE